MESWEEILKGVVLHNAVVYKDTCTDNPSRNPRTSKVYYAYYLTDMLQV